jgi:hypothetical protein
MNTALRRETGFVHPTRPAVRIGWVEPLIGTDLHDIPSNRRELADVDPDPPGEAIGWPYPGGWPRPPRAH